jgi:hypothetical protein
MVTFAISTDGFFTDLERDAALAAVGALLERLGQKLGASASHSAGSTTWSFGLGETPVIGR